MIFGPFLRNNEKGAFTSDFLGKPHAISPYPFQWPLVQLLSGLNNNERWSQPGLCTVTVGYLKSEVTHVKTKYCFQSVHSYISKVSLERTTTNMAHGFPPVHVEMSTNIYWFLTPWLALPISIHLNQSRLRSLSDGRLQNLFQVEILFIYEPFLG